MNKDTTDRPDIQEYIRKCGHQPQAEHLARKVQNRKKSPSSAIITGAS
jgi:hypothetical protein